MSSSRTIRLQNLSPSANVSLMLHELVPAARGSMKRGPTLTPILIRPGQYYDVCTGLNVSYEAATDICRRSPDVQRLKHMSRIAEIVHPPLPVAVLPVEEAPPPPALAPEPAPALAPEPELPPAPAPAPAPDTEPSPPDDSPTPVPEPETPDEVTEPAFPGGEPSMDWGEAQLRSYAEAHGVDVSRARSKTAVLRSIRSEK
ncbi:hypothetical protein Rctr197k_037 [Virus Rctr197k]|nr:hypothetical protein Rctr197k_037 [Virus Rctr197k]